MLALLELQTVICIEMQNSKLIALLRTLKSEERQRLEDFVASPYHNKNDVLIHLLAQLHGFAPAFDSPELEKSRVWARLYGKKPFDRSHFNHLVNYLLRLVEKFLAIEAVPELLLDQIALEIYADRKLNKHYRFCQKQSKRKLEKSTFFDERHYYFKFQQARIQNQHFLLGKQRVFDPAIQTASRNLDLFYLVQQLKLLSEMLDRQKKLIQHYDLGTLQAVDFLLQKYVEAPNPYLMLYRQHIRMLQEEENKVHYFTYNRLMTTYAAQIRPDDRRQLYFYAINYCVRKIAGGADFHENLFELYSSGLKNGVLFEDGVLSPWTFKNMVLLGLGLDKMQWVESFIEQYAGKLPDHFRKDAYHYNLAVLHYAKKDYSRAMTYLNQVVYSDISYKLWSKELLLKIYFETKETEPLLSLLTSFEALIKRHKSIPKGQKEAYRNFLKIVAKLEKGKMPLSKIRALIDETSALRERKWLLAQCS